MFFANINDAKPDFIGFFSVSSALFFTKTGNSSVLNHMRPLAGVEPSSLLASAWGEIPLDDSLAMLDVTKPNAAQTELLSEGMINLIGMLDNVCSGLGGKY